MRRLENSGFAEQRSFSAKKFGTGLTLYCGRSTNCFLLSDISVAEQDRQDRIARLGYDPCVSGEAAASVPSRPPESPAPTFTMEVL